ncbi:hypothetical protein LJC35_03505 [Parabacteroides sp. OttesenSCG-928-N08]|nr:hypothetical protein [Parabacteroides sp. OttesenSCG-928-N08]
MEEMQDRQLNEKESLELISRMIRNTQQRMEEGSGTMFLIWGYTTVIVTMLVWALLMKTGNYHWQWLWFLLPLIGSLLSLYNHKREEKRPRASTYVDKVINYIWIVLGITGFLLSSVSILHRLPILFIIVLIMGIGTTLTGMIVRFRPLVVSGIVGMLLSVVLSFLGWKTQMPVFASIFIVMMIIPGHYLNYKSRQRDV